MAFIIEANSPNGATDSCTLTDRTEALRFALRWRKLGYKRLRVIDDGRIYGLKAFAGTVMIGEKTGASQSEGH